MAHSISGNNLGRLQPELLVEVLSYDLNISARGTCRRLSGVYDRYIELLWKALLDNRQYLPSLKLHIYMIAHMDLRHNVSLAGESTERFYELVHICHALFIGCFPEATSMPSLSSAQDFVLLDRLFQSRPQLHSNMRLDQLPFELLTLILPRSSADIRRVSRNIAAAYDAQTVSIYNSLGKIDAKDMRFLTPHMQQIGQFSSSRELSPKHYVDGCMQELVTRYYLFYRIFFPQAIELPLLRMHSDFIALDQPMYAQQKIEEDRALTAMHSRLSYQNNRYNADHNYYDICLYNCGLKALPSEIKIFNFAYIDLRGNQLIDASIFSGMPRLRTLLLDNNLLTGTSGPQNLPQLNWLTLNWNRLTHFRSFSTLTNLETLNINCNQLNNIDDLAAFLKLSTLSLRNNRLPNLPYLPNSLEKLELESNQLTSVAILSHLIQIVWLNLRNNQCSDISPLGMCLKLRHLNVCDNPVDSINGLRTCTSITTLMLSRTQFRALPTLDSFITIELLYLEGLNLSSVDDLPVLPNLRHLHLNDNELSDVNRVPLACPNLEWLILPNNQISSLSSLNPLNHLTQLRELNLDGNPVLELLQLEEGVLDPPDLYFFS